MNSNPSLYIDEALSFISADDRDTWLRMAMAIKSEIGEEGFNIWNKWSQQSDSYNSRDANQVWKSIELNGGVGIGTLFYEAKANGWSKNNSNTKQTLEPQFNQTNQQKINTSFKASQLWKQAIEVKPNHQYLERKEVSAVLTMREIDAKEAEKILGYAPRSKGELLVGRLLVVPVKIDGKLSTVELIDEIGRKSALRGHGTKSGGYWAVSALPNNSGDDLSLMIGEGAITVLSANEVTGFYGVAALSSANLLSISKKMR
ncbi:MAG TPA: PriCT-2 domain-containing protein, partial [Legionella sp.]|nr:PriCT-2 domain-containing protein [Legionella sp.]